MSEYIIVHESAVPEYLKLVLKAEIGLKKGQYRTVSQATREVGISRSTYYKYHDLVFPIHDKQEQRRAVIALSLSHVPGALFQVLECISRHQASVLTISQAIPTDDSASVLLTLDISGVNPNLDTLITEMSAEVAVLDTRLISVQ